MQRLCDGLGIDLASVGLLSSMQNSLSAITSAVSTLESATGPDTLADVESALVPATQAFEAVRGLVDGLHASAMQLPSGFSDVLGDLPQRLVDYLIGRRLLDGYPITGAFLQALQALTSPLTPGTAIHTTTNQPAYVPVAMAQVNYAYLFNLLSDPLGQLKRHSSPARRAPTPWTALTKSLWPQVAALLNAFGLPIALGSVHGSRKWSATSGPRATLWRPRRSSSRWRATGLMPWPASHVPTRPCSPSLCWRPRRPVPRRSSDRSRGGSTLARRRGLVGDALRFRHGPGLRRRLVGRRHAAAQRTGHRRHRGHPLGHQQRNTGHPRAPPRIGHRDPPQVSAVSFTASTAIGSGAPASLSLELDLTGAQLVIDLSDGDGLLSFVNGLLGGPVQVSFDLGFGWSRSGGVFLRAGASANANGAQNLTATLPTSFDLGPVHIPSVNLGLSLPGGGLGTWAGPDLQIQPGAGRPHRVRLRARVRRRPRHRRNREPGAAQSVRPSRQTTTTCIGISAPAVSGAGLLNSPSPDNYMGAVALQVGDLSISGVGLLSTRTPTGQQEFSLVVLASVGIPMVEIGFGFSFGGWARWWASTAPSTCRPCRPSAGAAGSRASSSRSTSSTPRRRSPRPCRACSPRPTGSSWWGRRPM